LREAFAQLEGSAAFQADAAKMVGSERKMELIPYSEVERIVRDTARTPHALVERLRTAMDVREAAKILETPVPR
jgi:hypothetical protein